MSLRIKDSTGFFSRRQRCFILLLVVSALKSLSWQRNRDAANIFLVLPQLQIIEWNWPMQHTYMCAIVIGLYLQSVEIKSNTYLLLYFYLFYFETTFNSYFFLYEKLPNRKHTEPFRTLFFSLQCCDGVSQSVSSYLHMEQQIRRMFITPIFSPFLIVDNPSSRFL